MARRFDTAPIGLVERTPQGGLRAPATLTRVGIFEYREDDGTIRREYRAPEEVFSAGHLASLRGAPVTLRHPPQGRVDSESWRDLSVGHASDDPRKSEDEAHVAATVYVQDAAAVRAVEREDVREISLGYDTDYIPGKGVTPDGEPYDGRQTNLRANHIALVPRGRAGRSVGLRLDAEGNERVEQAMIKIKIDGKEYDAGSPEHLAAESARTARLDAAERELTTLRKERTAALRAKVKAFVPDLRADADDANIMLEALKKIAPSVDVDGKSPEYIAGAFACAIEFALKGAVADKAADDSEPEPVAGPPGEGAAGVRADRLDSTRQDRADSDLPADEIAYRAMVAKGSSLRYGKV